VEDLLHAAGDVQDCRAVLPQHRQQVLQFFYIVGPQPRGRLVHDDELRRETGQLRDLDELLHGAVEMADGPLGVHLEVDRAEGLDEPLPHPAPVVEEQQLPDLPVHEDVLDSAEPRQKPRLLVQGQDAQPLGIAGRVSLHRAPVVQELPARLRKEPRDDLHQGGLPGALVADNRVDLPARDRQGHPVEGRPPVGAGPQVVEEEDRAGRIRRSHVGCRALSSCCTAFCG
jgi:hypothetical protein